MFYIHKHRIALKYGGPEEGGWWYTEGHPVSEWNPPSFEDREDAFARCRELNKEEKERAKAEEDYEFSSVLAHRSTHYSYGVEKTPEPTSFPKVRPRYE